MNQEGEFEDDFGLLEIEVWIEDEFWTVWSWVKMDLFEVELDLICYNFGLFGIGVWIRMLKKERKTNILIFDFCFEKFNCVSPAILKSKY